MVNLEALEAKYHDLRAEFLQAEDFKLFTPDERELAATFAGAFAVGMEGKKEEVTFSLLLNDSLQGKLGGINSWVEVFKGKPVLQSAILHTINLSDAARKHGLITSGQLEGILVGVGLAENE